jgi:hypothetical protein
MTEEKVWELLAELVASQKKRMRNPPKLGISDLLD